ncbi:RDD family protein [Clavibacter michiganensis]|uniref:RDD family protein n=1 Tax=Clavibacter michiganensis TaxID=28447 RepID=UPI0005BE6B0D|nr:RDD family protein [Clavibacter michiganensis]MBE3079479.1 RDD family protein [Clavibacter michiganensis subsp. michiganensis]MBW8025351.1 RDD family protein [Clavibacter michiganensis subsp. michiganensis]MDO4025599.1 RDD family protein [Clavibacter michiganensis]MDO4031995.1 RDD family protein [Clavibacter michiganensis]MDO4035520.1 RDD family protein [Clavibacter michiganensis]
MAAADAHDPMLSDGPDALVVGEAVALDVRPAGFVLRAAGAAIDVIASLVVGLLLVLLIGRLAGAGLLDDASSAACAIAAVVLAIVVLPVVVEVASRGRSLGRWAVGARIVRADGGGIGLRHAVARALVGILEIYLTLGGLAALVGLLSPRAQRLGDLVAGTRSQHERVPAYPAPLPPVPPHLVAWASEADVGRLPDALGRRLARFLTQREAMTPASRARLAAELANEAAVHVSPLPAADPESFVTAVGAVRREREHRALMLARDRMASLEPILAGLPHGFPARGGSTPD